MPTVEITHDGFFLREVYKLTDREWHLLKMALRLAANDLRYDFARAESEEEKEEYRELADVLDRVPRDVEKRIVPNYVGGTKGTTYVTPEEYRT